MLMGKLEVLADLPQFIQKHKNEIPFYILPGLRSLKWVILSERPTKLAVEWKVKQKLLVTHSLNLNESYYVTMGFVLLTIIPPPVML